MPPLESEFANDNRLASILTCLPIPATPPRSLSLGCGSFTEYVRLHSYWSNWLHIGLDRAGAAFGETSADATCLIADARRLPFACHFSLILIRHPNLAQFPQNWKEIFALAPAFLVEGGVLLVTTYTYDEYMTVLSQVPLTRLPIPSRQLAPPDLVSHDRYVCAYSSL